MKRQSSKRILSKWILYIMSANMLFNSCDSLIGEDLSHCKTTYRVKFKYDYNLKYADAFTHEVKSVTLYAFSRDGMLVHQQSQTAEQLNKEDNSMLVNFNPNDYHLVVWGGLKEQGSFNISTEVEKGIGQEELSCKLVRTYKDGIATVDKELTPLFHGLRVRVAENKTTTEQPTISLTKDTKTIRIVLQQIQGEQLEKDMFNFTIKDRNGWLNYQNELLDDEEITYYPWRIDDGKADITRVLTINALVAEFSIGRLVTQNSPILEVTDKQGKPLFKIPIIDYALLVKGYYNWNMPDQEYLDRQDEYNFTFFLDSSQKWISSSILINGWRIVLSEPELQ